MNRVICAAYLAAEALLLCTTGSAAPAVIQAPPLPPVTVHITTTDPWNCYTVSEAARVKNEIPFTVRLARTKGPTGTGGLAASPAGADSDVKIHWSLECRNFWGQPMAISPREADGIVQAKQETILNGVFQAVGTGAFDIILNYRAANQTYREVHTIDVVPDPYDGVRPDSFFASNTGQWEQAPFWAKIGMKVARNHWAYEGASALDWNDRRKPSDPIRFDFAQQDRIFADLQAHGISVVGIVGYANPEWARSEEANRLHMYGPPRSFDEFIRATVPVVQHFTGIRVWEFWNEPWIYGWTWADTAAHYRELQRQWITAAKKARPDITVIAGNSASFLADNIWPDPSCYQGLLVGDSNHPYKDGEKISLRSGAQQRYIDYGVQQGRRMGLGVHYITENGTEVGTTTGVRDDPANASKVVMLHVIPALCGEFQANIQEGIGWGADQMRGTAAYAVMTHFLEDRVPIRDIWPAHPLIWGAIFANPAIADPNVPRADTLKARWKTQGRPGDTQKVAVVWSWTGPSEDNLDAHGTLTIENTGDIQAFDLMGNPTGQRRRTTLSIPFGHVPVYLQTTALSPEEFYQRIHNARLEGLTAVNLSAFSLTRPIQEGPDLVVRVQNQLNRPLSGTLSTELPHGWAPGRTSANFQLQPGELKEVHLHTGPGAPAADNQYPVLFRVKSDGGDTDRLQVIQAATIPQRTITVDGHLEDWTGVTPVVLDSNAVLHPTDYSYYLLHPNQAPPPTSKEQIVIHGYAAYDAQNLYLAFAVKEPGLSNKSDGDPAGHDLPWSGGDCFTLGFGFQERAKDDFHPVDDPWYWKGDFRDTDFQYVVFQGPNGPHLVRIVRPGDPYQVSFQTYAQPWVAQPEGSQVAIHREDATGISNYEMAIPLRELNFDPMHTDTIRFGFVNNNDENLGALQWSQAAGVFDYWNNNGSYQPTWTNFLAAQTRWGILHPSSEKLRK